MATSVIPNTEYEIEELKSAIDNVFQTDSTYPACLYRMNGNEKEWLNPPMILDTEYRTVERYHSGLVVYTKYIRVTFGGSGSISSPDLVLLYTEPSATNILEVTGTVYRDGYGLYSATVPTRHGLYAFTNKAYIAVLAEYGPSSYANIIIKYYKS